MLAEQPKAPREAVWMLHDHARTPQEAVRMVVACGRCKTCESQAGFTGGGVGAGAGSGLRRGVPRRSAFAADW